jgi:hypothetical protein
MMNRLAVALVLVGTVAALALAQGPRRDGEWEVKAEMSMPGMPMNMPPMTSKQCITPAEAADPQKAMPPQGRGANPNDCKVSDYKVDGNKVTWSMACEGRQPMTGKGEIVYTENAYTGTMTMDMQGRGGMTMKYTGKRLGDCKK